MEFKDYYQVMGVPRDASQEDIKAAYRRLARKYHPDVSREANAETRFKDVGEAYEVLKDPEKRAAYDRFGSEWKAGQDFHPPPDWEPGFTFTGGGYTEAEGFSEFFESLFGRRRAGEGRRGAETRMRMRGQDLHARIEVSLEDAWHGATRRLTLEVPELGADGRVSGRSRALDVRIPRGIVEGQRIRLAGQGGPGLGGAPDGDLYLEVAFAPHPRFRPVKRDLYLDLPLHPWEAALGATVAIPTFAGPVRLEVPPGSQPGRRLRLRGRGLPGDPPGDLYAVLEVVIPNAQGPEIEGAWRRLAQLIPDNPRADLEG
jgi:curved DNA-binding protein